MAASLFRLLLVDAGVRVEVVPALRGVTLGVREGVAGPAGFGTRAALVAPGASVETR